jgi:hypothetical protein
VSFGTRKERAVAGFVPEPHTFFVAAAQFLADNFPQVCTLGGFLRYPPSAIDGRERTMPGEIDDHDTYYRELAERCRISARGFLMLNPTSRNCT